MAAHDTVLNDRPKHADTLADLTLSSPWTTP